MEGFNKRGRSGELFIKRKEKIILDQDIFFLRGREQREFYHVDCLFFLWRMERASQADYLIGVDQKIPKQLIKITFLVKVGNAVKSDIESRFGIMHFSRVTPLWACVFSSTTPDVLDPQHLTECLASGRCSVNVFECWHNLIQASNDIVRYSDLQHKIIQDIRKHYLPCLMK